MVTLEHCKLSNGQTYYFAIQAILVVVFRDSFANPVTTHVVTVELISNILLHHITL